MIERHKLASMAKQYDDLGIHGSPIPPWVIQKQVPANMRPRIRSVSLGMESDMERKAVLAELGMKQFTRVSNADYDPIREMARTARRVRFVDK